MLCTSDRFFTLNIRNARKKVRKIKNSRPYVCQKDESESRVTTLSSQTTHIDCLIEYGRSDTPALDDGSILPGITRAHRIAQCREMGIPVIEEPFTVQEMMAADEVFFTSCSALCCRITKIDGKRVGGRAPALIRRIQDAAWREAMDEVAALK